LNFAAAEIVNERVPVVSGTMRTRLNRRHRIGISLWALALRRFDEHISNVSGERILDVGVVSD
jgi:hypothetical protein